MPDFDFSTSETLDNLDGVPEQFRSVYTQDDGGKYVINEVHKGLVGAVSGLSKALGNERRQHGDLKKTKDVATAVKEALGELGINSLDDAKTRISELTTTVAQNSKVDPAKIRAEIETTFATERTGFQTKLDKMQGTLDKFLVDNSAMAELTAAKGNVKLLMPIVKQQVKVVADGEDFVVRVLDADGAYRGDGKGGFMTVADLVKELKGSKDYAVAFASDALSGGGDRQNANRPSRETQRREAAREDGANRNPTDLISSGLARRRGQRS